MKKALALLVTLIAAQVGTAAHADEVVAKVQSVNMDIQSVSLTKAGILHVVKYDGNKLSMKLSPTNAEELVYDAQALAKAELATEHHDVICMMAINPKMEDNLYVEGNDGLRLVLSYRSCAIADSTFPKEDYDQQTASSLRGQLEVLARQLAGN